MCVIAAISGELLAIDPVREIVLDSNPVKIGRALFLINFGTISKMATMTFWEEETRQLYCLQLGKKYSFKVGLESIGDQFILHFLSELTAFRVIEGDVR